MFYKIIEHGYAVRLIVMTRKIFVIPIQTIVIDEFKIANKIILK